MARRIAAAARRDGAARTLLLDLDGTLAPIAPTPDAAAVPQEALATLADLIAAGWRVAIVSGRPAAEVRAMVPLDGLLVFGSHGLEGCWSKAPGDRPDGDPRVETLAAAAREMARDTPGALVEQKPAGIAFHDRGVPDPEVGAWRRKLDGWLAGQDLSGFERLEGRRVLELRPRGAHKGRVVQALVLPAGCDESLVAVGDDETDEDMFRELGHHGLAVRVGPASRPTSADERLDGPGDVHRLLARLSGKGDGLSAC